MSDPMISTVCLAKFNGTLAICIQCVMQHRPNHFFILFLHLASDTVLFWIQFDFFAELNGNLRVVQSSELFDI